MKTGKILIFLLLLAIPSFSASAYWVWSPEEGKFVNAEGSTKANADEIYDYAMELYKEKELKKSADQLKELLKKYPSSSVASEAQYRLGTIYEEEGNYLKAVKIYNALIEFYPQSKRFEEVIEREYEIANMFLSGRKPKLLGIEVRPSLPQAVEIFQHIIKYAPYGQFGDKSQYRLGLAYKSWGHFDEAVDAFETLIEQYPQSELIEKSRFQIAETSFAKSTEYQRDQRALDSASKQAEAFVSRYPKSAEAEKISKIKEEIDEKNAEKNYRVALYYEKTDYLNSALIYYKDVATRYPHTGWGQKANERLRMLSEPVAYLGTEEKKLHSELKSLEAQSEKSGDKNLETQVNRLKKEIKSLDKEKSESLNRRKSDIKRRERELKEKFKKLEKKKKLYKDNTSADFLKAMDRWRESLEKERQVLSQEKVQLSTWRSELGVKSTDYKALIPFATPLTPTEKLRQVEAKKLYKISEQKKKVLDEKEELYKKYGELKLQLQELKPQTKKTGSEKNVETKRLRGVDGPGEILKNKAEAILKIETELEKKTAVYEKYFGKPWWLEAAGMSSKIVTYPEALVVKSFRYLNPFDSDEFKLDDKAIDELLELRMHLKEKAAVEENIVETLANAFNSELALQEQRQLLEKIEKEGELDPRKLRKAIKQTEKSLRIRFQDISDRHMHKKMLLKELDRLLKEKEDSEKGGKVARIVKSTATAPYRFARNFLFGLPDKDVELTKKASKTSGSSPNIIMAKRVKDEIELESLVIEAKSKEIASLEKKLEILKAKASLAGGLKFRTALVKVPYVFIDEAVEKANRMVPKSEQNEILIQQLNEQTSQLEMTEKRLEEVELMIEKKTKKSEELSIPKTESNVKGLSGEETPDENTLQEEIQSLQKQLDENYAIYEKEKAVVEKENVKLKESIKIVKAEDLTPEMKKIEDKMRKVESELSKVIDKEMVLESKEFEALEKRIEEADNLLSITESRAMKENLQVERDRIEKRLSDLKIRHDFLEKEQERFGENKINGVLK